MALGVYNTRAGSTFCKFLWCTKIYSYFHVHFDTYGNVSERLTYGFKSYRLTEKRDRHTNTSLHFRWNRKSSLCSDQQSVAWASRRVLACVAHSFYSRIYSTQNGDASSFALNVAESGENAVCTRPFSSSGNYLFYARPKSTGLFILTSVSRNVVSGVEQCSRLVWNASSRRPSCYETRNILNKFDHFI